jgi:hypothetical protein
MGKFNKCCCCNSGSIIPAWVNMTRVRPAGDSGGVHYTAIPYGRVDSGYAAANSFSCSPPGTCGNWIVQGDLAGIVAQAITDGTDDISPAPTPDATHYKYDHNYYQQFPSLAGGAFVTGQTYQILTVGTTDFTAIGAAANTVGTVFTATGAGSGSGTAQAVADLRTAKRFGGMWVFGQSYWPGTFGWTSPDTCSPSVSNYPDQTKYLSLTAAAYYAFFGKGYDPNGGSSANYGTTTNNAAASGTATVDKLKRTIVSTIKTTEDKYIETFGVGSYPPPGTSYHTDHLDNGSGWTFGGYDGSFNVIQTPAVNAASFIDADITTQPFCLTDIPAVAAAVNFWNSQCAGAAVTVTPALAGYVIHATFQQLGFYSGTPLPWMSSIDITITRSNTVYSWSIAYDITNYDFAGAARNQLTYTGSLTLSSGYTAGQCYSDFLALLNAWDMSDTTLLKNGQFRQDEKLACAPLIIYSGVNAAPTPLGIPLGTVNDYSQPQNSDLTWPQRTWFDPQDYFWRNSAGGVNGTMDTAGGNTLSGPLYSGNIIAHTQSGSGKHFWFKAEVWVRVPGSGVGGAPPYTWNRVAIGDFSDPLLPDVAVRWLPKPAAQYDPLSTNVSPAPPGVFPQAWWSQNNGVIIGGKFVQATQKWPAQKFCRPCGKDKYAVAQTTVCCITSGTVPNLVIKPTANATAPLAMGGLAVNDFIIIEGDGVYKITALTASGGAWNCTVGTRIDTLPTGWHFTDPDQAADGSVHLGRIRWLNYSQYGTTFTSAPGIELRVGVTTSYAAGVLTVTTAAAQPYLRDDPTTGTPAIRTVSLYDSSMTLLVSGLVLARTDDSHFTVTTSNYPTAVWMIDTQFATAIGAGATTDWTLYDGTSKQTGLQMTWTFDQRSGHLATGSQPAWIGGTGVHTGTGIVGALAAGYSVSQFNYSAGACPSVVGMVPSSPTIENFPVQNLFGMPAFSNFDDVYGQHGQSAIQLTSQDALWEPPYKPDGGGAISFSWVEDNGSGESDGTSAIYGVQKFYAHHPLVEALDAIPAGLPTGALPTGIHLPYDASAVVVAPPFYPNGIPISTDTTAGDYADVETDWGFALNACGNVGGRFSSSYAYVSC